MWGGGTGFSTRGPSFLAGAQPPGGPGRRPGPQFHGHTRLFGYITADSRRVHDRLTAKRIFRRVLETENPEFSEFVFHRWAGSCAIVMLCFFVVRKGCVCMRICYLMLLYKSGFGKSLFLLLIKSMIFLNKLCVLRKI